MQSVIKFYKSTIGKKVIVALTGAFLVFFVIGHMAGNLKAFAGVGSDGIHKLDHYGEFLRAFGQDIFGHSGFLWIFRILLLVAVVLHVVTVIQLKALSKAARPVDYVNQKHQASSLASKTMLLGGIFLLAFIVMHILHLTTGTIHGSFEHGKVYANVYAAFQNPIFTLIYLIAMSFLSLHLYHGTWSMLQTLGIDSPQYNKHLRLATQALAVVVSLGFVAVPLAVFFGVLPTPSEYGI